MLSYGGLHGSVKRTSAHRRQSGSVAALISALCEALMRHRIEAAGVRYRDGAGRSTRPR